MMANRRGHHVKLLPYYQSFLEFLAKISWPALILVLALMFRGKLENVVAAISERVADLVEVRMPGASVSFGGRVGSLDEAREKFVIPPKRGPSDQTDTTS
jgi:uncharacterized protein involved in cysteine biosynthesis